MATTFSVFPINKGNMDLNTAFGDIRAKSWNLVIDGERIKLFDWDKDVARGKAVRNGTTPLRIPVKAGRHTVIVTFLRHSFAPGHDLDQHFLRSTIETGGLPGFIFFPQVGKVGSWSVQSQGRVRTAPAEPKIFVCRPANAAEETACATADCDCAGAAGFPPAGYDQDTELLMGFYQQGRNRFHPRPTHPLGARRQLRPGHRDGAAPHPGRPGICVPQGSPSRPTSSPGEKYRISDIELASRLSFFLWSSIPDDELLTLASQNKLHEPAVLEQQVQRMLADPRSDQLVDQLRRPVAESARLAEPERR